ncbi:MAG TPA: YjbH domain-containing protein [Negativicutes bacterium]|nr:YjbH domain-containing protein [Negativicutes bacterium]
MKKLFAGMLLFSLAASGTAAAAPSLNGPTGLINTPSADVVQNEDFSLGYNHLKQGEVLNFNIGIMKNVEMGISSFDPEAGSRQNRLNAKWNVIPETVVTPGLAVGVEDISDRGQRSAYIVGSKALPLGVRVHYGLGDGRYDGVFGGIEKTINPLGVLTGDNAFPATTLIAEYDGDDFNVGARLSLVSGVKIDAGWQDMKDFYVGFSITK